jgi:thymidylate synthase (FAD)
MFENMNDDFNEQLARTAKAKEVMLATPRNVLDHGYVRLVDYMGSDLSVIRAARVSYDADWRFCDLGEEISKDEKLIRRLWNDKHTSPFEAVTFTFEIMAPIFVFRQWHRHRTWSFNEVSARYTELPEVFYVPDPALVGEQSTSNKQGRQDYAGCETDREDECANFRKCCEASFNEYRNLLDAGWPRELARAVLPVSTYSRMFATVDLLNLMKFLGLRDHQHAQYEIQVYAQAMRKLIEPIVPVCMEAFEESR